MKLIFTKSKLPLSVGIRAVLREPVSHFAIVFEPDMLVFQSNLMGTNIGYFPYFAKHCDVVFAIDIHLTQEQENKIYFAAMNNFIGHGYGFGALLYFGWRAVLHTYFNRPWPLKNILGNKSEYLCVGLAKALDCEGSPDWLRAAVQTFDDLEMVTPYTLFQGLNFAKWRDSPDASL